jgi:hypothetical protein
MAFKQLKYDAIGTYLQKIFLERKAAWKGLICHSLNKILI